MSDTYWAIMRLKDDYVYPWTLRLNREDCLDEFVEYHYLESENVFRFPGIGRRRYYHFKQFWRYIRDKGLVKCVKVKIVEATE